MKKRHIKLKAQIIGLLLVAIVFMFITAVVSLYAFFNLQGQSQKSDHALFVNQVAASVESSYSNILNIATTLASDAVLQDYLTASTPQETYEAYTKVSAKLKNSRVLNVNILDIAVQGVNGNIANANGDSSVYASLYSEIAASPNKNVYIFHSNTLIIDASKTKCEILAVPIYQINKNTDVFLGLLYIAINPQTLLNQGIIDTSSTTAEMIIIGHNNALVWGNEQIYNSIMHTDKLINEVESVSLSINNELYQCQKYTVSSAEFSIYILFNTQSNYMQLLKLSIGQIALIGLLSLLFALAVSFIYRTLQFSLQQLNAILQKISQNLDLSTKERIDIGDNIWTCEEFVSISESFNSMMDEMRKLTVNLLEKQSRMYEMEMYNKQTEIAYLQSQINPHFLYNTLTLICGMASVQEYTGIISVTNALSNIYRYTAKANDLVTVATELEIVRSYLQIQTMRFEDRFTVEYNIAPEAQQAYIPKMILQPLVENAIIHGLEPLVTPGKLLLKVSVNPKRTHITLCVCDTGLGMSEQKLIQIKQDLVAGTNKIDHGIIDYNTHIRSVGLSNVYNRLHLHYTSAETFQINSTPKLGTKITITIPLCIKDDTHQNLLEEPNV